MHDESNMYVAKLNFAAPRGTAFRANRGTAFASDDTQYALNPVARMSQPRLVGTMKLSQPICVGSMQWGTSRIDHKLNRGTISDHTLDTMLDTMATAGAVFIDTAEGYGGGSSEERVGAAVQRWALRNQHTVHDHPFIVGSKFLPTTWRFTKHAFLQSLRASLARLGMDCLPLYMLHSPVHPVPLETWIDAACDAADLGT